MKILKKTVLMFLILMFILPHVYGNAEEDRIYSNAAFSDAAVAKNIANMLIMSVGTTYGFVNNIKSKLNETKDIAPYRAAQEVYVPLRYTARALDYEIISEYPDNYIIQKQGKQYFFAADKALSEKTDVKAEYKYNTLYVPAGGFCDEFGYELTLIDDLIIVNPSNLPFDTSNKKVIEQLKTATSYEWTSFQIHAYGFTVGIIQHPKNPNLVYCRTDVGGIYKLNLEGDKWICLTDCISGYDDDGSSLWALQSIEAFALDPNDENVIYIAAGGSQYTNGVVFKSTDGGLSWKKTGLKKIFYGSHPARMMGEMLAVDPNNSNVIYCGTYYEGLWRSEDGGDTWTNVKEIPKGVRGTHDGACISVLFDESSEIINGKTSVIYAGVISSGIYQTTDAGVSFNLMSESPMYPMRMYIYNKKLYVAAGKVSQWIYGGDDGVLGGMYTYKDGKWEDLTSLNFPNRNLNAIYIDDKNPDIMLLCTTAFTFPRKIYRTLDGGKSWDDYTLGDTYNANCCAFVKNPKDEKSVLLAWGFGVSKIEDVTAEKLKFTIYDAGIEELMFRNILCLPGDDTLLFVAGACDKGCILSKNINDWSVAKPPTHNFPSDMDFCEADPKMIVRAHMGHNVPPAKVIMTENSGDEWKVGLTVEGTRSGCVAVGAKKQKNGYPIVLFHTVNDSNAYVYRSKDYGTTWEKLNVPFSTTGYTQNRKYMFSDRVNGNVFYFWTNDGFMYRSDDGGDTWNKISSILKSNTTQCAGAVFGIEGHVWTALGDNGLAYSTDSGIRWNYISGMTKATVVTFGKPESSTDMPVVFVKGIYNGVDGIFCSKDYGKTWKQLDLSFNYGGVSETAYMGGDRKKYGRLFVQTNGRGILFCEPKTYASDYPVITLNNTNVTETVVKQDYIVSGRINTKAEVRVNNNPIEVSADGHFSTSIKLSTGVNKAVVEAVDEWNRAAAPIYFNVNYDPAYLKLEFENEEIKTKVNTAVIKGKINQKATVTIDGSEVSLNENNEFSKTSTLSVGSNQIQVKAEINGAVCDKTINAVYENTPPKIEYEAQNDIIGDGVVVTGRIDKKGEVRINGKDVKLRSDNSFKYFLKLKEGSYPLIIQARDEVGNVARPVITTVNSKKMKDYTIHDGTVSHTPDGFKLTGDVYKDFGELPNVCKLVYSGETENVTSFALRWDDEALYVGAEVIDDCLMSSGVNYYDRDCLEIYIDGTNSKVTATSATNTYKQFLIPFEGAMTEGAERITTIIDGGYTLEIKIPWKKVGTGVTVGEGHKIGLDIDNCDTSGTVREAQVGWCGTDNSYRDCSKYATLTLTK